MIISNKEVEMLNKALLVTEAMTMAITRCLGIGPPHTNIIILTSSKEACRGPLPQRCVNRDA